MEKNYDAHTVEKKWQFYWEKHKVYSFQQPKHPKTVFSIDTPPPTLSGAMHIGHAFSYCQGDFIARYQRMKGNSVLCPFGTDDNGLPTERLVEKLKQVKGSKMDRESFVKLCEKTVAELKPPFVQAWKDIGASCDFSLSYSTIDQQSRRTSQYSFLDLYRKGRVYREESPVAWCTQCQTAIAQAEFDNIDSSSMFNDVVFRVGGKDLIISTTRPELLPACVAVFVHPADTRYKAFHGAFAVVPLFHHEVPILVDEHVAMDKGSGAVMCCTFGDKVDIEWWRKFKLPLRVVFEKHGLMNNLAGNYAGKSLLDARKLILLDLKEQHLLVKQQSITHAVNVHERCGTPIEFLKTVQWYIRVLDMKEQLLEAADEITWHPEFMKKRYLHWVENLGWDWCISRQRFYGVPFPVWYCKQCGNVIVADEKDLPVDPLYHQPKKTCHCGSTTFIPEKDVMDTWATSSLTPDIVLGWPDDQKNFTALSPMTYRFQAHDILRTWAFYTIVKSLFHHDRVPWKHISISGFILDPKGEKMSKSKGNVIDPLKTMETYSADALRYWAAGSKLGEDLAYQEKDVVTGQKTVVKLWNAANFILPHLKDYTAKKPKNLEVMDHWLLSKLHSVVELSTKAFEHFAYWEAKSAVDFFFWHTLCDHYLEIVKDRLYNSDKRGTDGKGSAQYTLSITFSTLLKLFAPFLPFITEELYFRLFQQEETKASIHLSLWPDAKKLSSSKVAIDIGDRFVTLLTDVRQFKSKQHVSLAKEITLTLEKQDYTLLKPVFADLQAVTKAKEIKEGTFSIVL